jgi:L-asparaginase
VKKILVITAGGPIAFKRGPAVTSAVPSVRGEDFLALLPRNEFQIDIAEFSNVPGSHLTPAQTLELSRRIETMLQAPDLDGVVVTHGTDTLDETAYMLDLTVGSTKPVVVTGAARTATTASYDGTTNLVAAIRVAASPQAHEQGALVVFHDTIYAASEVQQVSSQTVDCFGAPGSGPLGRVEGERVWLRRQMTGRLVIPCHGLEDRVDLLRLGQGADDRLLRHAVEDRVAGVVLETYGSGRVPPWWLPKIREAVQQRTAVVVTSRSGVGTLGDQHGYVGAFHDLQRLGVMFAHNLDGLKARIKLMVALGATRKMDDVRAWFAN